MPQVHSVILIKVYGIRATGKYKLKGCISFMTDIFQVILNINQSK